MSELFIAILICFCSFVVIPFIVYSVMVFIDNFDNIHYIRDYVDSLKHHDMKEWFTTPLLNCIASIYVIFVFILLGITNIISYIWNKIPNISVFENKCTNTWKRFSNWFMNIKIK